MGKRGGRLFGAGDHSLRAGKPAKSPEPSLTSLMDEAMIEARFKALPGEARKGKFKTTTAYCKALLDDATIGPMTRSAAGRWLARYRKPRK